MKRQQLIYIAAVCCMCWSGCSEHDEISPDNVAEKIALSAVVENVKMMSRSSEGGVYTDTIPSGSNNLLAAVWFSLESGKYPEQLPVDATDEMKALSAETNIPIHGEINYKSGTATFPNSDSDDEKPKYPTNDQNVYCVGLYPTTGWTVSADATKAEHDLSGMQDLMFAPEITGRWNEHFTFQRYRHLLTWLKICVCATTPEAATYWGKLKKITLNDLPNKLTVDLTQPEDGDFELENVVTYSSETRNEPILNKEPGIDMGIMMKEVASVFCKPSSSYTISIECENGRTVDKEIQLTPLNADDKDLLNYPAGLQYVLILYFHPYNVVEGVCTLNAWNAQNEDLYPNS